MRNTSKLLAIPLGLFLALATCAFAQTPQTSTQDSQPQTVTPSQPMPPSQTGPGSQESPSSAPPTGAASNGKQGGAQADQNKGVDIDRELQLTQDQKQRIAAIVDDENRQIEAVRDDNSMTLEQKQQKVLQIRQVGTPKIKAILTPEQLQKLAALQQRMRDQQTGNQNGAQSDPQGQPQR